MPRRARAKDNGWIKYFADGQKLHGLDRGVPTGQTSWSKSQLHNMTGCRLDHDGVTLEIRGHGEYWQSDDLATIMRLGTTQSPEFISRRIAKRIEPLDRFFMVFTPTSHHLRLGVFTKEPSQMPDNIVDMLYFTPEEIGKWLIVELDADSLTTSWRVSEGRV